MSVDNFCFPAGDLSVSGWETCLILGYRIKMAVCLYKMIWKKPLMEPKALVEFL